MVLAPATQNVLLHTAHGDITIALEIERAPVTAKNFLRVDAKRFDGINFYRGMKLTDDGKYGPIQGGLQGNSKLIYKTYRARGTSHHRPLACGWRRVDGDGRARQSRRRISSSSSATCVDGWQARWQ